MLETLHAIRNWGLYKKITATCAVLGTVIALLAFTIPQNGNSADEPKKQTQASVGGLVGKMEGGTIDNSYVMGGQVSCEGENCSCGTLVGSMAGGEIKNSGAQGVSVNCTQDRPKKK